MDRNIDTVGEQALDLYHIAAEVMLDIAFGIALAYIYLIVFDTLRKKVIKSLINKADDPLLIQFFSQAIRVTNIVIAFLLFLYAIGKTGIVTSILGAAGISAFVIGFAFKDIGENFLAGIILAFKRPFNLGDTIKSNGIEGIITKLNIRDTVIKTFDGKDVSIPNGVILKNPLFNYTIDGFLRSQVKITINNPRDIPEAIKAIEEATRGIEGVITRQKQVMAYVSGNEGNAIDITVNYWYDTYDRNHNSLDMKTEVINSIYDALEKAKIPVVKNLLELKSYDDKRLPINISYDNNDQS